MRSLRSLLEALAILALIALVLFLVVRWLRSDPQMDRQMARFDQVSRDAATGASAPVHEALERTASCAQDAAQHEPDDVWSQRRKVVWDPCVQQGVTWLEQTGQASQVAGFRQRLWAMEQTLSSF